MADKRVDVNPLALLAVVLVGLLIGVGIVNWPYGDREVKFGPDEVSAVVATRNIEAGTVLDDSMLEEKIFNERDVIDAWASDVDSINGYATTVDLAEGHQISLNSLRRPKLAEQ